MTMLEDLREVVRLLESTTPGPWLYRAKSASWHKPIPEGTNYSYGEFIFKLGDDENDASYYDEEFLVKAVQFMQKHAAQIEQDARDAARFRWHWRDASPELIESVISVIDAAIERESK